MYMNDGNKTKINLKNKSVFITGVAGFIGSNLAKRLLSTPHRNDLSFEEWMDLDVKYVKERSFWVDWKIIFKTFKVCLLGRGE